MSAKERERSVAVVAGRWIKHPGGILIFLTHTQRNSKRERGPSTSLTFAYVFHESREDRMLRISYSLVGAPTATWYIIFLAGARIAVPHPQAPEFMRFERNSNSSKLYPYFTFTKDSYTQSFPLACDNTSWWFIKYNWLLSLGSFRIPSLSAISYIKYTFLTRTRKLKSMC